VLLPKNPPAHIAYAAHFASHGDTIGKGLQGPLDESLSSQEAISSFAFSIFPTTHIVPSFKLIEVILELEFHIRHSSIPQLLGSEIYKDFSKISSLLNSRTNENVGKNNSNQRKRAEDTAKRSGCNYCRLSPDFVFWTIVRLESLDKGWL